MTERIFTAEIGKSAAMARYDAGDLAAILAQIAGFPHTAGYLDELHAQWAWQAFDKLAAKMAAIPRPEVPK